MHNILPTIVLSFFFFPFLSALQSTHKSSRATFYENPKGEGTGSGACGFGEYGKTVKGGRVTGVSGLFHNGTGCGACYKVRCKDSTPDYLAFMIVNQGGKGDVTAVQLCQEKCEEWKDMRRAYGGVWDIVGPPKGPISVKILTESDEDGQNWVQMDKVIPYDWKAGDAYDSSVQMFN